MIKFLIGFFSGSLFGVIAMALANAASEADSNIPTSPEEDD